MNKSLNSTKDGKFGSLLSVPLLLVLFFVLVSASTIALRSNNMQMIELRQSLLAADRTGDNVDKALYDLRFYVVNHMNTSVSTNGSNEPPIQLVNTYYRAILQREVYDATINKTTSRYNAAVKQCKGEIDLYKQVSCVENYLTTHGNGITNPNLPNKMLYEFNFVSPWWSPDAAGLLIIASVVVGLLLCSRVFYSVIVKNSSK